MPGLEKNYMTFTRGRLPKPYIERVYIASNMSNSFDENTSDGLMVDIVIYFQGVDENNDGEITAPTIALQSLSNLYFYAVIVIGNQENNNIINKEESVLSYLRNLGTSWEDSTASSLYSRMSAAHGEYYEIPKSDYDDIMAANVEAESISDWQAPWVALYKNFDQITIDDFSEPELVEEDMLIYKSTATLSITMYNNETTTFSELFDDAYENSDIDMTYKDLNVFVFSSPIDIGNSTHKQHVEASAYRLEDVALSEARHAPLVNKLTSDVAYENVYTGGIINDGVSEKWFSVGQGALLDGDAMQTLDGVFHLPAADMRLETYEIFYNLIPPDEILNTQMDEDAAAEMALVRDNILYIIETESEKATMLVELNEYRKTYPHKNETSILGRFYETFSSAIFTQNSLYKQQQIVEKRLIRSYKIVDKLEEPPDKFYDPPEVETDLYPGTDHNSGGFQSERIYEEAWITRYAYSSAKQSGESSEDTWEQEDSLLNYGFIFFDFEKAMRNDTAIAATLDLDKIQTYFGSELTAQSLKFKYSTLARYYDGFPQVLITTYYKSGQQNPDVNYIEWNDSLGDDVVTTSYYGIDIGIQGSYDTSWCMLRNARPAYDPAAATGDSLYRLACFQFQDYQDLDTASDQLVGLSPTSTQYIGGEAYGTIEAYSFYLVMQDESDKTMEAITGSYYSAVYDDFTAYADTAAEICNYNDIEGYFNQFFVDKMTETYTSTSTSPWIRMPIIFNIHRDLLYNHFNGDTEELLRNASIWSERIGPETGNLEEIGIFAEKIQALWTNYYSDTGAVTEAYEAAFNEDPERSYFQRFLTLPEIYYGGEPVAAPSSSREIRGTEAADDTDYYTNLYETTMTLYNTNLKEYVDEKIQEYDDLGRGNKQEKLDIIRDIKEYIGEIKDNAKDYADTINGLLEAAGVTTSTGDYNHFPTYTSAFKDVYAANPGALYSAYGDILDKDSNIEDEAAAGEETVDIDSGIHDLIALRLFRYGF